jgi:hypothetical protein
MKKIQTILTIAALCGAMLTGVTACQNLLDPARPPARPPAQTAQRAGFGNITIRLGDAIENIFDRNDAARTVYPGTGGLTWVYTFTKTSGQPQRLTPTDGIFTLEYGEWTVTVKAYAGTVTEENLAASGTKTFTVNAASQTVDVELAGITATGTGTFSYRIQYPQGARVSSFTMRKLPKLTTSVTLNYSNSETSGGLTTIAQTTTVDAGFYFVTLRLEQEGRTAGRSEVVHIFNNLTSEFGSVNAPVVFTAEDFTAVPLSEGVWADGDLASGGQNWYRFTATAATQFIHVNFNGTLSGSSSYGVNVQVYDSADAPVDSQTRLNNETLYLSRTLASNSVYYIKVTPYNTSYAGTYQIGFTASWIPPTTTLTADTWADDDLASGRQNWYSFTATAATQQYIHVNFGTLTGSSSYGVNVQVYDSVGAPVDSQTQLNNDTPYLFRTLTSGSVYYIKVTPYNTSYYYDGTYQIGFNTRWIPPTTALTVDTWADGDLANNSSTNWYSFTTTADTQYIHVNFNGDSRNGVNVQVYDSTGAAVDSQTRLYASPSSLSRTLTSGQVYYIQVTPYPSNGYTGTYQIAFNARVIPPTTTLTVDTWADGNLIVRSSRNWYSFTATADTQYMHANINGKLYCISGVYVQVYDSSGSDVGSQTRLNNDTPSLSRTLTNGSVYYIHVTLISYTGTYQIAFNTSSTPPSN